MLDVFYDSDFGDHDDSDDDHVKYVSSFTSEKKVKIYC